MSEDTPNPLMSDSSGRLLTSNGLRHVPSAGSVSSMDHNMQDHDFGPFTQDSQDYCDDEDDGLQLSCMSPTCWVTVFPAFKSLFLYAHAWCVCWRSGLVFNLVLLVDGPKRGRSLGASRPTTGVSSEHQRCTFTHLVAFPILPPLYPFFYLSNLYLSTLR